MPLNGSRFDRMTAMDLFPCFLVSLTARRIHGMDHGCVHLSCSSHEAMPDLLLTCIICVQPRTLGHAAAELGDVFHGKNRWVLGTTGQILVPLVLLELGTDTAMSSRQAEPSLNPGAWICSTGCCNSHTLGFDTCGVVFKSALNFTDEFCSHICPVPEQCNKVLNLYWVSW